MDVRDLGHLGRLGTRIAARESEPATAQAIQNDLAETTVGGDVDNTIGGAMQVSQHSEEEMQLHGELLVEVEDDDDAVRDPADQEHDKDAQQHPRRAKGFQPGLAEAERVTVVEDVEVVLGPGNGDVSVIKRTVTDQHTRELINTRKSSHKHNKDLSHPR